VQTFAPTLEYLLGVGGFSSVFNFWKTESTFYCTKVRLKRTELSFQVICILVNEASS